MLPMAPASNDAPRREGISIQHAAIILGVHEDTIRRWVKNGYLLAVRCGPKLLKIPRSELARLRRDR
jgi:excisionase family DNA binding protein